MIMTRSGTGKSRAARCASAIAMLVAGILLQACSSDCPGTAPTCVSARDSESRFTLTLLRAPSSMDAMIIEVKADDPIAFELSPSALVEQSASANSNNTVWRAVIIGGPKSGALGTMSIRAPRAAVPTITVIDVAADEAGEFLPLPASSVALSITRVK